ncbi:MAG: DUF4136 domain-containing protein [Acidobacteria bacterium]|nr:DUF4136 domain-containing protein [Acidobacteriota bacterium]
MVKRALFILAMLAMVAGCTSMKVSSDWDRTVNFSRYRTFEFLATPATMDQLTLRRIRRSVAAELRERGMHRPVSSRADLLVAIRVSKHLEPRSSSVSIGYGGGWWGGWGGGVTTNRVRNVPVGTLIVDLVDARSNQLVWRGTARGALSRNPQRRTEKILEAIDTMFGTFPRPKVTPPARGSVPARKLPRP